MRKHIAIIILAGIVLAASAPYINSLHNPFIWDEEVMIVGNPIIKHWKYLPLIFKTNIFGSPMKAGDYYRPLYMLSFMLDYYLWKLNTIGYHLFNVIFHSLNALLLYILITEIGLQRKAAVLAGLLFALFPVNSHVVTLIGGRIELILGALFLLCSIAFINGINKSRIHFLIAIFIFILAIFTKESALLFPLLISMYAFLFLDREKKRVAIPPLLTFIVIIFIYGALRFFFLGFSPQSTLSLINEASFIERIYTVPRILVTYIRQIAWPIVLKSEYNFVVHSFKDPYVWLGAPLLILFFVSVTRFLKPKKYAAFFSFWFLAGLLPYYNLIIPLHATLLEHWVYFPAMGFAALMSMTIFRIMDGVRSRPLKHVLVIIVAVIMIFYAIKIVERNKEWSDPFVLYKNDVEKEPNSFLLHCNLGVEYFRKGMMDEAKKEFIASIEVSPGEGYDMAYNNLGVIYAREGNIPAAIENYKKSIAIDNCPLAYANLGSLYNNLNMHKEAALLLEEGRRLYPLDVEIKYQLAVAYYKSKRLKLAEQAFREVKDLQADYSQTKTYLDLLSGRTSF